MTSVVFRRVLFYRVNLSSLIYCKRNNQRQFSSLEDLDAEFFEEKSPHIPVLLKEVIENLNLKRGDLFLDMTFGAGGHTKALLKNIPDLKVFALDRDPVAVEYALELQKDYPDQIIPLEGKFSDLPVLLDQNKVPPNSFDGILFDLGGSSMQFDNAERGFSIKNDGPLDMRMDGGKTSSLTAADVVAYADEIELRKIFRTYGGERNAHKIAKAIIHARAKFKPLKTTKELNDLIETVLEGQIRHDKLQRQTRLATKVFKALRAFVNNEINELNYGLILAHIFLKPGGRAAVISFDSSEDQIVKRQFQNHSVDNLITPLDLVYLNSAQDYDAKELKDFSVKKWAVVNKKVIVPSDEEIMANARSRSAKLRVATKINPEIKDEPSETEGS